MDDDNCGLVGRFRIPKEARYEIKQWQQYYNDVQPHSPLNFMPPAVYAKQVA